MRTEPLARVVLPLLVFVLAVAIHFWLFASAQAQTAGQWAVQQHYDPVAGYIATQEILLGISYALMAAFTSYVALLFFAHRAKLSQLGASAGFTAALYAFGCFLIGCCGSPMLAIYIGFLGPSFVGVSKQIVLGVTMISVAYGYMSMAKFRKPAKDGGKDENKTDCVDDSCACAPTDKKAAASASPPADKKESACIEDACACAPASETKAEDAEKNAGFAGMIAFAFVGVVAILILAELLVERAGLLEKPLELLPWPLVVAATLAGGYPIFKNALMGLKSGKINADLLMSIGIAAAMAIGEFSASTLIVFFMGIAHFLERFTFERSRKAIRDIVAFAPKSARVERNGREALVPIEEIRVGDTLTVKPGERIGADGTVVSGSSSVDESPITGESMPKEKRAGDGVFAGTLNQHGQLEIRVKRAGADTMLGKIIHLVEEAEASRAPVQKFADKFSSYYLPVVSLSALATYLITGSITHAIAVVVVACPCAIALATPMSVVAAVGNAAKNGIVVKGGVHLENLSKVDTLVVDKTGTLTHGRPEVTDIYAAGGESEGKIVAIAAALEIHSEHPLARAVLERAEKDKVKFDKAGKFHYKVGMGVSGTIDGKAAAAGNEKLMSANDIDVSVLIKKKEQFESEGKTVLLVASGSKAIGLIAVSDTLRNDVAGALGELRALGIGRIVMLTGDNVRVAAAVAKGVGISEFRANQLPHDKVECVKALQKEGKRVLMIGDGVNDAPALAQADVGIAMGSGTDVSIETSDIALMRDEWAQVPAAVRISRRAFSTIKQNIAFGVIFNVLGIALASVGILTPMFAAAAQSLPDLAVFVNSSRLLFLKNGR